VKADEIRNHNYFYIEPSRTRGSNDPKATEEATDGEAVVSVLQEIAAQLSELNENLAKLVNR
jgi:hypothetical protein